MTADRRPVVVGVDGSPGARVALEWAWAAAVRRGAPLHAVSAFPVDDWWADPLLLDAGRVERLRAGTAARLDALVADVRAAADPGRSTAEVPVHVTVVAGAPAEHLVQLSEDAGLLVVGSRGRGGLTSTLLGSVALHCAASAACPVVVVHPAPTVSPPPSGGPADVRRVVVGLDDTDDGETALGLAVDLARELDAEVEVVVAVQLPLYWGESAGLVLVPLAELEERALARARDRVADLPDASRVRVLIETGPAGAVLVQRSVGAALLVVGSRSRSRLSGMLLGSVALHCVVHAACPVSVVHPDTGQRGGATPGTAVTG